MASHVPSPKLSRPVITALLILLLSGLFLRFFHLRDIPPGYYYDEMDHVVTGEAVARFGTDLSGTWSPINLTPLSTVNLVAELPSLFHAVFQRLFGFGPQSGHFPNAFFGLATVALASAFTYLLFKRPLISGLVAIAVAVNPWHVHISRTAFEAPISVFFQLLLLFGLFLYWTPRRRLTGLLVMSVGIFFAYFTYHGAKLTVPALVLFALTSSFISLHRRPRILLGLLFPVLLTAGLVIRSLHLQQSGALSTRSSELLTPSYLASQVDTRRRQALSFPGQYLLINKFTLFTEEVTRRYFFVFDPNRLLAKGVEDGFQLSLFVHPYFYLTSLPLLIIGFIYAAKHFPRQTSFLILLLLISPITSLITISYQATFRSALTYLLLLIFVGLGLYALILHFSRTSVRFILFALLIFETAIFAGQYFGRYPILAADNHYFFERLLSNYIARTASPVTIVTPRPYITARALISYLQLLPSLDISTRHQFTDSNRDTFILSPHLTVTTRCPDPFPTTTLIFDPQKYADCTPASAPIALGSPIDSRAYYYLSGDTLCSRFPLAPYVYINSLNHLPSRLTDFEFCSTWLYAP